MNLKIKSNLALSILVLLQIELDSLPQIRMLYIYYTHITSLRLVNKSACQCATTANVLF